MTRKSAIRKAGDDATAIARASFGSAAISATGAILQSFARALDRGKVTVEQATPAAQKTMGELVSKSLLPVNRKRTAPKRKTKAAKKVAKTKTTKRAAAKKKRTSSRRKR